MIKNISSLYFDGLDKGIVIDNAYDIYARRLYIKYIEENNINYLRFQDTDMNLAAFFPNVEYVLVPEEAENLQGLYSLKKIKGIEISAHNLEQINLSSFTNLEYLIVTDYLVEKNKLTFSNNIKHLCFLHSDTSDLKFLYKNKNLESLQLEFCYRLKTINGIQNLQYLNKLTLDYCLKLSDISNIKSLSGKLNYLRITDCNKIHDQINYLSALSELETLYITVSQTRKQNNFESLMFIKPMKNLKRFVTNYKINDCDLTQLKQVEEVEIL
ncbi:MAG: hypothetical protein IJU84_02880 [Clostridia bacterium]|nr:hypothetical protein [Clostridia bacterium]